ncbi:aminopeptidase N [Amnibacterium setariae]|uniref:Aminopeptidase N n=1 Tax=Amnibacterium setariae TaxID=2306585 RepID=A0A3A1U1C7_9MICO|nr:aminopeptidase N [Amnibacterium setariae]RIX28256.1 aminopeptidase N [Amnibacterium setariae]
MPGENLTRVEAEERAAIVQPSAYEVELDLTKGPEVFGSRTTVHFTATPGASTFIDAITRDVRSVTLNGTALDPAEVSDGVRIQLPDLQAENVLVVDADGVYTNTGEGLHRFVDPVDDEVYLYTQFEVPDSRRMYAVFEQPDLKATFRFTVTAPARWSVTSNQATPEPEPAGDGVATWRFEPTPVISSYITALIAGPYLSVTDELTSADGRTIALGAFARASLFDHLDADYVFEKTKQGFEFYERIFGVPYPFDKYDQLFVPEYNAGAMENAGAVTFTETYVFRSKVTDATRERRVITILHELAHMWFGDLVTMQWWNDLWLNESFAEFISTLATAEATEWKEAWTTFNILEKNWAYTQDQLPSTHPIVAEIRDLEDVQVNFDGITYAKGASVLKQLVAYVGREPFLAGVHEYFVKHGFGNTTLKDLLVELEATSGRDLTAWSEAWLETAGVNTLTPEIETDEGGWITSFTINQSGAEGYLASRPHRLAVGFYELVPSHGPDTASRRPGTGGGGPGERLVRTERFELDVDGASTDVPELVGKRRPALVLVNDDDLAYAKIRLDEESLETAIDHLAAIESPLARSLVWSAVWDATRDAEARPRDFVRLVLNNVGSETESTTVRQVLQQALLVASGYVAPAVREETLVALGDGLQRLAFAAEAGSDAQFQFVRALASVARTPEQLGAVRGLLSGRTPLPGLDVDTDLRWELLIALVAGGQADGPEITATLAADDTATGRESAAHARAVIPTAEGKAAAWASVVDSAALPNATVRATTLGFRRAIDLGLLEPYVERYFATVEQLWEDRSYAIAETLARGLYPSPLASRALVDASQQWLDAHPDAAPALRRVVVENTASVQRALAAQERDARE